MDFGDVSLHTAAGWAAVGLGVLGPLLALGYALRVEHRDSWRTPMVAGAVLSFAAILGAYFSGRAADRSRLLEDPGLVGHVQYAERLVLPAAGYFVLAILTGLLNPRTGVLRLMLPMLLTGFAVVVLALILLSGDEGPRLIWDRIADQF